MKFSLSTVARLELVVLLDLILISYARTRRNSFDQVSHKGVFIQLPFATPPTVRPPPYANSDEECPGINERENWVGTLCGDLNKGSVPVNPMGHTFQNGASYPFELMKNKTLLFFRHALPVLRNDKSLPKVARYSPYNFHQAQGHRSRRSVEARIMAEDHQRVEHRDVFGSERISMETDHEARAIQQAQWQKNLAASATRFCNAGQQPRGSLICNIYHAMWGKPQKQTSVSVQPHRHEPTRNTLYSHHASGAASDHYSQHNQDPYQVAESKHVISAETPATPCTSSAEYLTPVFARNHEGAWRYVVQIPREGYFTQTVEVTKCLETSCHFMEGSCLTSPRWQSLLVAEMFYPHASFPVTPTTDKALQDLQRSGEIMTSEEIRRGTKIPSQCDGLDEIGCFQVRLFYDWFLIPGSCKCWKRSLDFTRVHQSRR